MSSGRDQLVGFAGAGDMGLPMVRQLLRSGLKLLVWNRSTEKTFDLAAEGARIARSPAELMAECDTVGLCLSDGAAVEQVVFGEHGLLSSSLTKSNQRIVDFSSVAPGQAVSFSQRARARGVGWIDCPVSGGVPAAQNGTLIMFAGGDAADLDAVRNILKPLASKVTHMGPAGSGQATKVFNQMIVACSMMVMAETFAAARAAGVDVARLPEALAGGFADSKPLQIFGPRMANHQFKPRLGALKLMQKDVGVALDLVSTRNTYAPVLSLCQKLYRSATEAHGLNDDDDLSTLIRMFEAH
jgi:3-hydroxyisobutyrate dehydrogenase